jgi:hypothetical protein
MTVDITPVALGNWVLDFVRGQQPPVWHRARTDGSRGQRSSRVAGSKRPRRRESGSLRLSHIAEGAGWRSDDRPGSEERSEDGAWVEELKADLATIILAAHRQAASPPRLHRVFGLLRPFADGNGRCGRALFVWQTLRRRTPYGVADADEPRLFEAKSPVTRPPVARQSLS